MFSARTLLDASQIWSDAISSSRWSRLANGPVAFVEVSTRAVLGAVSALPTPRDRLPLNSETASKRTYAHEGSRDRSACVLAVVQMVDEAAVRFTGGWALRTLACFFSATERFSVSCARRISCVFCIRHKHTDCGLWPNRAESRIGSDLG